jgi:hypothetical protein
MRFLIFSFSLLFIACASDYKMLKRDVFDENCFARVKRQPVHTQWYDAGIDVVGKHISGLLLVKTLESGEKRVVFTNEAGVTFLDFGWKEGQAFHLYFVIKQLRKKAVIEMLRRDFELLIGFFYEYPLMRMHAPGWTAWRMGNDYVMRTSLGDDVYFIVTDPTCEKVLRVEAGSQKKRVVSLTYPDADRVLIRHHTFNMSIVLRKIDRG